MEAGTLNNDALDKYRTFYTVVFLLILSTIFAGVCFAAFQKGYVQEILFCPDERETNINQILPEKNLLLAPSRILSRITDRRYYPEENYLILPNRQIVPGSAFFQEPATADQVLELYQVCQEEGRDFLYVLCPGKPLSDKDLREYGAPCFRNESADAFVEKLEEYEIPHLDLRETIMQTETPYDLFYMTDHHWTAAAAEIAFKGIAKEMKLNTNSYKYSTLPVTTQFRGTLASSSGIFSARDTISIPVFEPEIVYAVNYVDENKKSASLYDSSKLEEKSKYDVFFGGNYSQIKIDTSVKNSRVLLVIKDSYANSVVPMLLPYFRSIIIVDPRYYNETLQDTIDVEAVTDILWLYNANTFLNDTSISAKFS